MTSVCRTCRYFVAPNYCYRYPPVIRLGSQSGYVFIHTEVRDDHWCGEYERNTNLDNCERGQHAWGMRICTYKEVPTGKTILGVRCFRKVPVEIQRCLHCGAETETEK